MNFEVRTYSNVVEWTYTRESKQVESVLSGILGMLFSKSVRRNGGPRSGESGTISVKLNIGKEKSYPVWNTKGTCFIETKQAIMGIKENKFGELVRFAKLKEKAFKKQFSEDAFYYHKEIYPSIGLPDFEGMVSQRDFHIIKSETWDDAVQIIFKTREGLAGGDLETYKPEVFTVHHPANIGEKRVYINYVAKDKNDTFHFHAINCTKVASVNYPNGFVVRQKVNESFRDVFFDAPDKLVYLMNNKG